MHIDSLVGLMSPQSLTFTSKNIWVKTEYYILRYSVDTRFVSRGLGEDHKGMIACESENHGQNYAHDSRCSKKTKEAHDLNIGMFK